MNGLLKSMLFGSSVLAFLCNGSLLAAEPACSIKDRTEKVVLIFCPRQSHEREWLAAGQSACPTGQHCNVWIWDDHSKMPSNAPKTDAELSKGHAASAVAIWVNDSQSLIKLKKVH